MLTLLFPERCPACDELTPGRGLCSTCAQSLYPTAPCCPVCAQPQTADLLCRRCRAVPPPFERVVAPFRFGGELAQALRRFKYGGPRGAGRPELARALGALLAPALAAVEADVLVPVPLHRGRLRMRGFAQAHVLAAATRAATPLAAGLLVRARATEVQAGLGRLARRRNVAGAFVADPAARGRRILLVDDVVTTGATAAACARALRAAGAAAVVVAALARAE
jgi:ComF family protein